MIKEVVVKAAGKKGKGVFALRRFKRGEFVFRGKKGRIVHIQDLSNLSEDDRMHLNEIDYDTFEVLNSPEKFLNHSCDPNSIGKGRSLFALKPINRGH
jgi:hypothetical protein